MKWDLNLTPFDQGFIYEKSDGYHYALKQHSENAQNFLFSLAAG